MRVAESLFRRQTFLMRGGLMTFILLLASAVAAGAGFRDIAVDDGAGITYRRAPSATFAQALEVQSLGVVTMDDFIGHYPIKPHGAPGVALLDHDGDGDLDIYVTNGPGAPNSLYSSQIADSGRLTFVDVAVDAGVDATDQDSTGVCFGDIDNDGDPDLYVLGRSEPNRLFENLGNGTFADITEASGVGGGDRSSVSCSMGDVDGDGLLDIAVANNFDMASNLAIFVEPFALNQRNFLFVNAGGNAFVDRSEESGVADVQEITWALALVDLDQDGDLDLVTASDNAGLLFASQGGVDRGFITYLANDGTGRFTDTSPATGWKPLGDWMGLAFADLDHNGTLDVFGTNTGDYFEPFFGLPIGLGEQASRWFLQNADGTFSDPGVGEMVASAFGWGAAALDYDNDGDSDLVFYGGLDAGPIVDASNPGCLLINDGTARFGFDDGAFAESASHVTRIEHGLAVGDLDADGLADIVSVSAINLPTAPLGPVPYPIEYGSLFDGVAAFFPSFLPGENPGELVFSGAEFSRGTLAVEINDATHDHGWVAVDTLGTTGLTSHGRVNRDGIGAVVRVTPKRGATIIQPVLGGASYASQNSLTQSFGLGSAKKATVEILWPGGVVNRLYDVRSGERVTFPEIPCSITDAVHPSAYSACVRNALDELVDAGALDRHQRSRFLSSALRAFQEERDDR